MPAVAAGRVVTVDRLGYPGIAGRRRLVDDLATLLLEAERLYSAGFFTR